MEDYDVIIPVYNGEPWIGQALESVLNQTVRPRQIIVVDDASADASLKAVARYPEVKVVRNPEPGSAARARNFGLKQTTSPWVAFLDQDDIWHPRHIEFLGQALQDFPAIACAAAFSSAFTNGSPPAFNLADLKRELIDPWADFPFVEYMEPSLILFRRQLFDQYAWPDQVKGFGDRILWYAIAARHAVMRVYAWTVGRRKHEASFYQGMIKNPLSIYQDWIRACEISVKHHQDPTRDGFIKNRLALLVGIGRLLESVIARDEGQLRIQASLLEKAFPEAELDIVHKTLSVMAYYYQRSIQVTAAAGDGVEFYAYLYRQLPRDCQRLRQAVEQKIFHQQPGLKFYVRLVLSQPLNLHPVELFQKAVRHKWDKHVRSALAGNAGVDFLSAWGEKGGAPEQFLHVEFFSFDREGNLLVSDADQALIKVFSREGKLIGHFGGKGTDDGRFTEPEGLAVDRDGNIFVADSTKGRVQKFTRDFKHVLTFGGHGYRPGCLNHAEAMVIGMDNLLYIADSNNHRVSVFDVNGRFLFAIGSLGWAAGQLNGPQSCKVDSRGQLYVTDLFNHRIQVFSLAGKFVRTIAGKGKGPGQVSYPSGLAIDRFDRVYVCDMGNNRIQVFDRVGVFLYTFGREGQRPGEFKGILDVAVSSEGDLYVADCGNCRIQRFRIRQFHADEAGKDAPCRT